LSTVTASFNTAMSIVQHVGWQPSQRFCAAQFRFLLQ